MKDGDVSLILKDVTINDTGTYECLVFTRGTNMRANLVIVTLRVVVPPDQKNITAESGQKNVTLPCQAPNNDNSIISVEWSRADMASDYVLLYRDQRFDLENQHPSFKNRVDLQDRQMKDGDVSLILKDVTFNDAGTYECRVFSRGTNIRKRANLDGDPISIIYLSVVPPDQKTITAESGQKKVTLTCRAPNNNIKAVWWSRADLGDEYVLLYRDGHFHSDDQHPSFKNRVDLQDRQMKDGDVSLILKNVTISDTGTYNCHVIQEVGQPLKLISSINLHVVPPGRPEDGSVGLMVGLSVSAVLLVAAVVGFLRYRKHKQPQSQDSYQPPV